MFHYETFFFYGTLRKGASNYKYIDLDNRAKYLGKGKVKGYSLYKDFIPYMIKEDDGEVIGDVFQITDKQTIGNIRVMELGSGYDEEIVEVELGDKKVKAIAYTHKNKSGKEKHIGGDWLVRP